MSERLSQTRFDEEFRSIVPQDVTPAGFLGLEFIHRRRETKRSFTTSPTGELGRFVREIKERIPITSPEQAAQYLQEKIYTPFDQFDQEEIWTLLLDTKNQVTHEAMVYRGTINTASIRVAEILKAAVRTNAPALILSHCHPSGVAEPSPEDVHVTRKVGEAATLLDVELLDHIIVGRDQWVSLKERGLGFDFS